MQDDLAQFSAALECQSIPLTTIETVSTKQQGVSWSMLRLDLVDKFISGNKAFKLLPALLSARSAGCTTLISFGGFHSNHIHALAAAGKRFGFKTVGIIRGYSSQPLSATLIDAQAFGMQIFFVDRAEYKKRYDCEYQEKWQRQFDLSMVIPEGGANALGLQGAQLLAKVVANTLEQHSYDAICVSAGTGSTALGLVQSDLFFKTPLYIFSALDKSALHQLPKLLPKNVKVLDEYCGQGFAKTTPELLSFMLSFERENGLLLDPVYTAKMCLGINTMIAGGEFKRGSHIVSLHTGGLQGRRGVENKLLALVEEDEVGYEN